MDKREFAAGVGAGLLASAALALASPVLGDDRSGHERAARALDGRMRGGRLLFAALFGAGWGLVYAGARRRWPELARLGGLPFAVPFFLACDGAIGPATGLAPGLKRRGLKSDAKELAGHAVWTAAAEAAHRLAGR